LNFNLNSGKIWNKFRKIWGGVEDVAVGPHGGRWGWSGSRGKFVFKLEFEVVQDLK
jgi:hypothetical protein